MKKALTSTLGFVTALFFKKDYSLAIIMWYVVLFAYIDNLFTIIIGIIAGSMMQSIVDKYLKA